MDAYRVKMWAKTDPFLIGVLPFSPPPKFNLHYLRKMATYVRTRSAIGFYPRLRWPLWRHIACGKLQIGEDVAWLYFETFHNLFEQSAPNSLDMAEMVSSCNSIEEYERLKSELSVDTLQFLLFLYVQQLNKVSLRNSLIEDEWPSPRGRSSSGLTGQSNLYNKNWDDYSHHVFLQNNIHFLLELLLEPDQLTKSSHSSECSLLSMDAARALGFLIEGTIDEKRTIHSFVDLATWQPLQSASGYLKTTDSFSLRKLESWIKECIVINSFGMSSCIILGQMLAWAQQINGCNRRAKISCNNNKAPPGNHMIIMRNISKQTLAKSSETLVNARVKLINCNEAYIYLLSPLRCVTIEKCQNSTIVLGPVQTVVHVQMCDHVKVVSVCHRLSLSYTIGCTFHILTPTHPVLFSGNQGVIFGPYHTHYAMLEDHMGQAGLATLPNYWDRPQFFSLECDTQVWTCMSPREFYLFVVPFEMEGDTMEIPGGLPPVFKKSLEQRQHKIQVWQKTVKDAKLSREQKKRFQALVEHKFNDWLAKTGNRDQLDSLVPSNDCTKQAAL